MTMNNDCRRGGEKGRASFHANLSTDTQPTQQPLLRQVTQMQHSLRPQTIRAARAMYVRLKLQGFCNDCQPWPLAWQQRSQQTTHHCLQTTHDTDSRVTNGNLAKRKPGDNRPMTRGTGTAVAVSARRNVGCREVLFVSLLFTHGLARNSLD